MRILYSSLSYVPSRSASSVHVMKMCAALASLGHEVELVTKSTPTRMEPDVDDDHAFYGVAPGFVVNKLPRPARRGGGLIFASAQSRRLARRPTPDLVYSRDLVGAWLACRRGLPLIFEAHGLPNGWLAGKLARIVVGHPALQRLVHVSSALEQRWRARGLTPKYGGLAIAHDACDPFDTPTPDAAESDRLRAGYVGHLYPGRGVERILAVAESLPEIDFHLVGGREAELEAWRARDTPPNMVFHGFVPPARLPGLYGSFDILLMPYQRRVGVRSGRSDTAAWMSPMKMFEYMAARRPIVSSDLPVLREVLAHDRNALLVDPTSTEAWTSAVRSLAADGDLRTRLAEAAHADFLAHHTWEARAAAVLEGIST